MLPLESNFYINLLYHISLIEILKDDLVIIQYATTPAGKNIIIKLLDERQYYN